MLYPIVIILRELGVLEFSRACHCALHFWYADFDIRFSATTSAHCQQNVQAARIDGAGFWGIFFKVMLPMSLPILVVAIILQVTGIWNDFLFGIVYTRPEAYPCCSAQYYRELNIR